MLKNNKQGIRCNKCHKIIDSAYKFCPICGYDLSIHKNDEAIDKESLSESRFSSKEVASKYTANQLICKLLGAIILLFNFILLVWFCWSGYVGSFVKFNKPIPESILSIDGEFFNFSGDDNMYNTFLVALIMFGMIKIGFWFFNVNGKTS